MKTTIYTVLAFLALCASSFGQGGDFVLGGAVVINPLALQGLEGVTVTAECTASGTEQDVTNSIGVWSVEVFEQDDCTVTFDTSTAEGNWDLYQGGFFAAEPLCPRGRVPTNTIDVFTDDPSEDGSITTYAVVEGEKACDGCGEGFYNPGQCISGDWNGDGLVTLAGDLIPLYFCIFLGDCSTVRCYWGADMNADGFLSMADVDLYAERVLFQQHEGTCEEVVE